MAHRPGWWLGGWVTGTALRPAGDRWLVTVRFSRGVVLRNWLVSEERAQAQLAEAEQLRPPPYWAR